MFVLFIRGVTLEGAGNGVKAFFKPEVCCFVTLSAYSKALYSGHNNFNCFYCIHLHNKGVSARREAKHLKFL